MAAAGSSLGDTACVTDKIANYEILRPLAVGGMGETLLATDGDEQVVLKRLLPHLTGDAEAERCFQEEMRIASRLQHPNIVRFLEVIEHEERGMLVLEYVEGCSARDLLADARNNEAPLQVAEACAVVEAAARGLHFAHCLSDEEGNPLGLVHRDVSPANILVSYNSEVKVIDFGVAKAWDAEGRTATGVVKGKVGYMSPEQALCEPLDARADVFALGIVLWELLVGDRLFSGDGPMATAYQILEAPIPKPSSRRADIPARVDAICMNALARSRDKRIVSAKALEQSLAEWRSSIGENPDLGLLVKERFPKGTPAQHTEEAETMVARPKIGPARSSEDSEPTALVGGPRSAPLPPPEAPAVTPLDGDILANTDLASTRIDSSIAPTMQNVRRASFIRRYSILLAGLVLAGGVSLALFFLPIADWFPTKTPQQSAVFFSYEDQDGIEVIVSSLADVPPERRPAARRIDLEAAPFAVENQTTQREISQALELLKLRLGPPHHSTASSSREVIEGLVLPLAVLFVLGALVFWLLSRIKDFFARWSLRLFIVLVFGVGLVRIVSDGALGRPGLSALSTKGKAVPVNELAPALKEQIQKMVQQGALGQPKIPLEQEKP